MFNKPHRLKTIMLALMLFLLLVFSVLIVSLSNFFDIPDALLRKNSEHFSAQNIIDGSSIEAVMTDEWSDVADNAENISDIIHAYEIEDELFSLSSETLHTERVKEIIIKSAPEIEEILDENNVSGAFMVLDVNSKVGKITNRPGLYLRRNSDGNFEALYGNDAVISKLGYTKSPDWSKNFVFDINDDFSDSYYDCPSEIKHLTGEFDAEDFGYWSDPFVLNENSEEIITYTMPIYRNGVFYGIIGVEIPANSFFNHAGFVSQSNKSEIITIVNNSSAAVITGTVMSQTASELYNIESGLVLSSTVTQKLNDMGTNAYRVITSKNGEIYAYAYTLDIYPETSHFYENEWTLISLVSIDEITSFSDSIVKVVSSAFMVSILLSIVIAILLISVIASPTEKILKTAENIDITQKVVFDHTKIRETDTLIDIVDSMNLKITNNIEKLSKIADMISVPTAIFESGPNDKKVYVSKSIVNILSLNPAIVINSCIDKNEWNGIYENLIKSPSYEGSYHINKGEDDEKWLVINTFENNGGIIGVITDITASIKERQRIEYEREYDAATGIINRYSFFIRAEKILPRSKQAVISIWSINNLKHINDNYGYITGDKLITAITLVMQTHADEKDTLTARLSGDEFVTLIYGSGSIEDYKKRIYALNDAIKEIVINAPDGTDISVELHAGVATYPTDATTINELLKCADYSNFSNKLNKNNSPENQISEYRK